MGTKTTNETTLPGGSSLILSKSQNMQASAPNSSTSASHPVHCALLQLESHWHQETFIYESFNRGL